MSHGRVFVANNYIDFLIDLGCRETCDYAFTPEKSSVSPAKNVTSCDSPVSKYENYLQQYFTFISIT